MHLAWVTLLVDYNKPEFIVNVFNYQRYHIRISDWFKLKGFADISKHINVASGGIFLYMEKILWSKKKMLVTSISSFSHNVFERLFLRVPKLTDW